MALSNSTKISIHQVHDHLGKLRAVVEGLSDELKNVVIIPFCHSESDINLKSSQNSTDITNRTNSKNEIFLSEFLLLGKDVIGRDELKYEQLPFYQPLFIMYSSGTTGKPKCIVSYFRNLENQ